MKFVFQPLKSLKPCHSDVLRGAVVIYFWYNIPISTTFCRKKYFKLTHTSCILKIPVKGTQALNSSQNKFIERLGSYDGGEKYSRQKRKKELPFAGGLLKVFIFGLNPLFLQLIKLLQILVTKRPVFTPFEIFFPSV